MKKILSITLSLLMVAQPLSIAAEQKKERKVATWFKERFVGMRELVGEVIAVADKGADCLAHGEGKDCTPEKGKILDIFRSFIHGDFKSVHEGFIVFLDAYTMQVASILRLMGVKVLDASPRGVMQGIKKLASQGFFAIMRAYRKAQAKLRARIKELKKEHEEKMAKIEARRKK